MIDVETSTYQPSFHMHLHVIPFSSSQVSHSRHYCPKEIGLSTFTVYRRIKLHL